MTSKYLIEQGVSYELQRRYVKSDWFEKIAPGVLKRANDEVTWVGALHALQYVEDKGFILGGKSAMNFLGGLHYLYLGTMPLYLFAPKGDDLPSWFVKVSTQNHRRIYFNSNTFLNLENFNVSFNVGGLDIKMSNTIKSLFEVMYLANSRHDIVECYELMEAKFDLNVKEVQMALEQCNSIKAKRLFLFCAKKAELGWFDKIDLSKVNLGTGKRSLIKNGMLEKNFNLILPPELVKEEVYEY